MAQPVPEGVGVTAIGMAGVRAGESGRPDCLFDDPYAAAFVVASAGTLPEPPDLEEDAASGGLAAALSEVFNFHGVVRTRFFDDHLLSATAAGCSQVVIPAAGLDTRAFRLAWPRGLALYELDRPDVLDFKEKVLTEDGALALCQRRTVATDLREDWSGALIDAGFQPSQPTAWLVEGLLIYLSSYEATRLFTIIGRLSGSGSQLALDYGDILDAELRTRSRGIRALEQFTSTWKGGFGDETPQWLRSRGWQVRVQETCEIATSYGRACPEHAAGNILTALRTTDQSPVEP